jgi:hypothetical protein
MRFIDNFLHDVINLELPALCVMMAFIFWTYHLANGIYKFLCWITGSPASFQANAEHLAVSKIAFVREVVSWCAENLGMPPKITRLPQVTIRYYKHRKWVGLYFQPSKHITIYWNGHPNLISIINTVIHEYQHFLDLRNTKDDQEYAKEFARVGYYENLYEKRARKTADNWERQCYEAMVKKGVIRK